ncbi:MAG: hypothetical protein DHS80DRAFT_32286 [Piptocephalis tieghemiana]|nr:MAG: hypothetical protein DHS80DRAFT_32286 [Piptocephalis tieghemiana]
MNMLSPPVVPYEGVKLAPPIARLRLIGYEIRHLLPPPNPSLPNDNPSSSFPPTDPPSKSVIPFYTIHITPAPSSVPTGTCTSSEQPSSSSSPSNPQPPTTTAPILDRARLSFHRKPYTVYRRYSDFAEFGRRLAESLQNRRPQVLLHLQPLDGDPSLPHMDALEFLLSRVLALPKPLLEIREIGEFFGIWKSDVDYKLARNLSDPLALTFASRSLAHEPPSPSSFPHPSPSSSSSSADPSSSSSPSSSPPSADPRLIRGKPLLKRTKSTQGVNRVGPLNLSQSIHHPPVQPDPTMVDPHAQPLVHQRGSSDPPDLSDPSSDHPSKREKDKPKSNTSTGSTHFLTRAKTMLLRANPTHSKSSNHPPSSASSSSSSSSSQDSYMASLAPHHRHPPSTSPMLRSASQASSQSSFGAEIVPLPLGDTARAYAETTAALDARKGLSADSEKDSAQIQGVSLELHQPASSDLIGEMERGALAIPGPQVPPPSVSQQRTLRRKPVLPGVVGAVSPSSEGSHPDGDTSLSTSHDPFTPSTIPPMGIISRSLSSSSCSSASQPTDSLHVKTSSTSSSHSPSSSHPSTPSLGLGAFNEHSPLPSSPNPSSADQERPHTAGPSYSPHPHDPYREERIQSSFPSHIPPWSPLHPRHQKFPPSLSDPDSSTTSPSEDPGNPGFNGLKRRKSKKKGSKEQLSHNQEPLIAPWTRTLQRRVSAHRLGLDQDQRSNPSPSLGHRSTLTRNHTITGRMGSIPGESLHGLRPRTSQATLGPRSADLHHTSSSSNLFPPSTSSHAPLSTDPPSPLGYRLVRTMASAGSLASAAAAAEEGRPLPEEERAEAEGSAPTSLSAATEAWRRMAAAEGDPSPIKPPPISSPTGPPPPPLLLDEAQEQKAQARMALDPTDTEPRRLLRANSLARLRRHMAARNEGTLSTEETSATPSSAGSAPASTVTTPTTDLPPSGGPGLALDSTFSPHHLDPLLLPSDQGTMDPSHPPHPPPNPAIATTMLSPQNPGVPTTSLHRSRSSPAIPDSILLRRTQAISPLLPAEALQRAASISRSGGSMRRPRGKTFGGDIPSSSSPSSPPVLSLDFPPHGPIPPSSSSPKVTSPASRTDSILGIPKRPVNEYEEAEAHLVDLKVVVDKKILIKLQIDRDIPLTKLWHMAKDKFSKCGYDAVMTPDKVLVYRDPAGNVVRLDGDFALSIVLTGPIDWQALFHNHPTEVGSNWIKTWPIKIGMRNAWG